MQYRHLMASSWISSAQYGHFFTIAPRFIDRASLPASPPAVLRLVSMAASMGGRIAVLVSGSGTNLQALLDDPDIRPHIALVLSDRPDVGALDRAAAAQVETLVIAPGVDRTALSEAVADALRTAGSTWS